MMKQILDWVLARPYRPALVAVAGAPLPLVGPFLATVLLVVTTAHAGLRFGVLTAAAGGLVLTGLVAVTGSELFALAGGGAISMLVGAVIGGVLRWARSFSLAFQSLLLICFVATAGVSLFGPDPETLFGPMLEQLAELFAENSPEDAERIRNAAPLMLGFTAAGVFAELVVALVVGYWALGFVREDFRLGESFRALRLGRVLGVFGMVLLTLAAFVPLAVMRDLAPLAFVGFLVHGLAVMHAWAHGRQWHPALLGIVYALFLPIVPPLTIIVLMGLSGAGLLDNVFDLRAPLEGVA